ncbi:MAG: hypothetical protein ACFE8N_04950, partial [Promethearchaeota archaeon]
MTEVSCKICDEKINFSLTNPNSYIHKSESGNSMIGKLFTIRVSHSTASDSLHINVVVIDEEGNYRAHKDCYEEKRSEMGATSLWSKIKHYFPSELQGYLSLATREEKDILIQIPDPQTKTPSEWYSCLSELMRINNSQLLTFLAVKWGFIIGKGKELIDYDYKQNSWSYPIYLRLLAR